VRGARFLLIGGTFTLLGACAVSPPAPEEVARRMTDPAAQQTALFEAEQQWRAEPTNEEAIIWYGRRLAYVGRIDDAILAYTEGLTHHPRSIRLLRHRGHRYISARQYDDAVADLRRAAQFIEGSADEVEPDGMPNAAGIPRSTLHTNVWYHLALAQYLRGEFADALIGWRKCEEISPNDDMRVACWYWQVLALHQLGRAAETDEIFKKIPAEPDVIENDDYLALLRLFQGTLTPIELARRESAVADDSSGLPPPVRSATLAYGVAMYQIFVGDPEAGQRQLDHLRAQPVSSAFGYLAAEEEVRRRSGRR